MPHLGDPEMNFQGIGNNKVAFVSRGAGPSLVLLHGLGQDHRIWEQIQPALPEYTTIAYDLRGHGQSPVGDAAGTLAQLGDDLIAFLAATGPAVCIGFSLGGVIALWAASARPDLVKGVIAVATSSVVGKAADAALAERIELFESASDERIYELLLADTSSQVVNPKLDVAAITRARVEAVGDRSGYLNGARAVRSMREVSVNERLGSITVPVLIINGEGDQWCPRRAAEIMLEQLPAASFIELPGVGHLITDEDPTSLVTAISRWLQSEGQS